MTENILFKTGREESEVNIISGCSQHSLNGQKAMYRWKVVMQLLEMPSRKRSMNFLSNDDRQLDAALPHLIWYIWCSCWHTIGDRKDTFLRLHTNEKLIGESWVSTCPTVNVLPPRDDNGYVGKNYLNVYCFFVVWMLYSPILQMTHSSQFSCLYSSLHQTVFPYLCQKMELWPRFQHHTIGDRKDRRKSTRNIQQSVGIRKNWTRN